jgi:membrane protease YdiL (CAAX protease family)
MKPVSSPESLISDPSMMTKPPVGAQSLPLRFLIVGLVVGVYIALGFLFHLTVAEYQLLGIPILLIFQLGIQRRPLRTLWVRSGPPLRLDAWFLLLWLLFSLFPAYAAVREVMSHQFANAAEFSMAIVGAFGLAYALRAMRAKTWGQLGLCIVTVGIIGLLPQFLSLLLPHVLHFHTASQATTPPTFLQSLTITTEWFLIGPVGFVIEEVFFRGALDTYLHRGEQGTGWLSAIVVSALWGLWHLPSQAIPAGQLLSTIVELLVAQILVGVPLSLWWRKSGNLVVNDTAHALLDAVRNGLAGAGLF